MSIPLHKVFLMLGAMGGAWIVNGQSRSMMLKPCPECVFSGQAAERPPSNLQVIFLKNPKPYDFSQISGPQTGKAVVSIALTGRVVSVSPLILEVLEMDGPNGGTASDLCNFLLPVLLSDAKLKGAMSNLQFNELVHASLFFGGNQEFPHELVLSGLSSDAPLRVDTHTCFNSTGLLFSFHGLVEYVNVYNDGTILYQDPVFNRFGSQKLTREELAQILRGFAAAGFDGLSSSPPHIDPDSLTVAERNSLTLLCSRLEIESLPGPDSKLAPLLAQLEDLKARATAHTFYLLLVKDRIKLTVLPWPFPEVPLKQLEHERRARTGTSGVSDAMRRVLPEDFLSRLPLTFSSLGSPPDPNRFTYFTDEGTTYSVTRAPCGFGRPHCNTFADLTAYEIPDAEAVAARMPQDPKNPIAGTELVTRFGTFWSGDASVRLSQVGDQGVKIPKSEYEKYKFYFELFKAGSLGALSVNLIEDGYLYRGVRICQVDPQAPPAKCLAPKDHESH